MPLGQVGPLVPPLPPRPTYLHTLWRILMNRSICVKVTEDCLSLPPCIPFAGFCCLSFPPDQANRPAPLPPQRLILEISINNGKVPRTPAENGPGIPTATDSDRLG